MSKNIVEELPARKHAPAAAPVAAKKGGGDVKGGVSSESSEKKIRQAVYDIRYRARREDIDLRTAYAQYMSNSSLSQAEKTAVRAKLFGKEGGGVKEQFTIGADDWAIDGVSQALYKVFVEKTVDENIELSYLKQLDEDQDNKKYKVRVKDKNGKTYVRYADRAKITQLRQNPNIQSVEMTEHGEPYEGERKKTPGKLDPVGKEDADIDNDGDVDKSDKYLHKRRKAIGSAIRKRAGQKLKEDMVTETKEKVDNYKKGENGKPAVVVAPVNSEPTPEVQAASKRGIYAHLELNGSEISESRKRLLDVLAEKAAYKKKKKKKSYSEAVVNTADCEKKPEDKEKDMRGTYAKINNIKNKFRSMGAKNPIVMLDDIDDDKDDKVKKEEAKPGVVQSDGSMKIPVIPYKKKDGPKTGEQAPTKVKGPKTKKPAPSKGDRGPATEKRYNPFKDGRTPTSASQTTGP